MGCGSTVKESVQEPKRTVVQEAASCKSKEEPIDLVISSPKLSTVKKVRVDSNTSQGKMTEPSPKRAPDFILEGLSDKVVIKENKQINSASCKISNCTRCKIYLHDCLKNVSIINCNSCELFIGPSVSIAFTECNKCRAITCSKSLTISQCNSMKLLVFFETPAAVTDSTSIHLGCFSYYYDELQEQFAHAELNVWNNRWSEAEGCEYLPETVQWHDLIQRKEAAESGDVSPPGSFYESAQRVVPLTVGRMKDVANVKGVVLMCYNNSLLEKVYEEIKYKVMLQNTRVMKVRREKLSEVIGKMNAKYKELEIAVIVMGSEDEKEVAEAEEMIVKLHKGREELLYLTQDLNITVSYTHLTLPTSDLV
eukprot:TRINITY_DN9896_c0_g2_i2.p1 TRINITY_DN9896_c0_g2~~TRINITY_DN9896_c0_g2_i2.p1  ORF type:complete len:366 (+),score=71.91 TRINITY_DN9896_c0_g2_i2:74-1171(+)